MPCANFRDLLAIDAVCGGTLDALSMATLRNLRHVSKGYSDAMDQYMLRRCTRDVFSPYVDDAEAFRGVIRNTGCIISGYILQLTKRKASL